MDWLTSDYDWFQLFTEDDCRRASLEDCFCVVAIFRDGDCWKKKISKCGSRPKWHQRIQIILGTKKGLLYLHEECNIQTMHCDIKPQKILLDDSLIARISDFGLAKFLKTNQT